MIFAAVELCHRSDHEFFPQQAESVELNRFGNVDFLPFECNCITIDLFYSKFMLYFF